MTKPQAKPSQSGEDRTQIEAPAVVTQLHVQDRTFRNDGGQIVTNQTAWRNRSPLEAAYDQGKLAGGSTRYAAPDRFAAGQLYGNLYRLSQASGRDSTQALNSVRSGGGTGLPLSQAQSDAIRKLVTIDSHMGSRDRKIVRMVCGEGHFPSEAVREVVGDYKDTVSARFRESLDALIEAFESARRYPGVNMRRIEP